MKVKAVYRDPKANPFEPRLSTPVKRVEVPDETPKEKLEEWAKAASDGFEFVDVVMEDGSPIK